PFGVLPEGPTRDFNLMLRGDARGELFARTLVDSLVLLPEPGVRWLVYVNRGRAQIACGGNSLTMEADDAALLTATERAVTEGGGELVLVKLYGRDSGIENREP
ncbi:MAG TPA: HutD family protein, partial [Rhodanobacteraceae bacterium]|nr:HutD family protein [Rhodanobacteraceae bacterium]